MDEKNSDLLMCLIFWNVGENFFKIKKKNPYKDVKIWKEWGGGGGGEIGNATKNEKFSEKCPCSHNDNTVVMKKCDTVLVMTNT